MSSLLATASLTTAITVVGLLPLPVPLAPPTEGAAQPQTAPEAAPEVEVSGHLQAADGRLRRGCKDYQFVYTVTTRSEDWSFDISVKDRKGRGVNAQSLIGPSDPMSGVLTYRLCRWATVPGLFTVTGALVSYDGAEETPVTVAETFRLRRRNR